MTGIVQTASEDSTTGLPVADKSTGGAKHVTDAVVLAGNSQVTLAISGTGAQTASGLAAGKYAVWTTVDCMVKLHAATASDVTTSTGFPVYSVATPLTVIVPSGYVLGAITSGASGTLSYHKVD